MDQAEDINIYFILLAGTAGMLLLAAGIITFVVTYQKKLIHHQHKMQELQLAQQQELLYTQIQAQEKERSRVAADLHDDVGATLAALRLSLAQVEKLHGGENRELFTKSKILTDKAIDSIRSISHALTPAGLEVFGPVPVLEELVASLSTSTTEIGMVARTRINRQPLATELALYRVTQELLNNALKHSGASQVMLQLEQSDNLLLLEYSDNGKGFDVNRNYNGIGLKNICNRVKMVGGEIGIYSQESKGTRIDIKIPLKKNH